MFDSDVRDSVDKKITLLRELRDLYNSDRKLYNKIKKLPMKSRVMRDISKHSGQSVVFISSDVKTEFYLVNSGHALPIDFLEAVKYLKAKPEEQAAPFGDDTSHYDHVNMALNSYSAAVIESRDDTTARRVDLDRTSLIANNFLRTMMRVTQDMDLKKNCDILMNYINDGVYAQLPRALKAIAGEFKNDKALMKQNEYKISRQIDDLIEKYHTQTLTERNNRQDALRRMSQDEVMYAYDFKGHRYDVGTKCGFLQANIEFALRNEETREEMFSYIQRLNEDMDNMLSYE